MNNININTRPSLTMSTITMDPPPRRRRSAGLVFPLEFRRRRTSRILPQSLLLMLLFVVVVAAVVVVDSWLVAQPTTSRGGRRGGDVSTLTLISSSSRSSSSSAATATSPSLGSTTSTGSGGEADRALERGMRFEKSGQPRLANACFLEAATLLQCYLEMPLEFGHVTKMAVVDNVQAQNGDENDIEKNNSNVHATLAYTLVRLAFLALDALGDASAAVQLYEMATTLDPRPSATAFAGWGTALEAAASNDDDDDDQGFQNRLEQAVKAYDAALQIQPQLSLTRLSRAVALERLGQSQEAESVLTDMARSEAITSCWVDSWGYVRWHTRTTPPSQLNLHRGTRDMLQLALEAAKPLWSIGGDDNSNGDGNGSSNGLICEFGVGSGRSLRMTHELLPLDVHLHGFDTFTGLPQAWHGEPAGSYSTGGRVPVMEQGDNVHFHCGLFGDTLPQFFDELDNENSYVAYANIDCDLYTSTLDILEALHGRIRVGTILVFDEYISHPTWRQDEFRAWRECCKRFGWKYEYLAFSLSTKQAVVRVTSVA